MAARTGNILFSLLALFLYASPSYARTWYVKPDSTGDAPTIQAAIDSAQAGDEVVLAPGTYTPSTQGDNGEQFNRSMIVLKAGVNLRTELGPEVTVLDMERLGRGRVIWAENVGVVLIEGLTVMRGVSTAAYGGGGIAIIGSSTPTISNCIIRDCQAGGITSYPGGGMYFQLPTIPTITHCQILNNQVLNGQGGGITCRGGTIESCIFRGNGAGSDPGGRGGALSCRDTQVRDCVFENNVVAGPFGVAGAAISDGGGSQITGCKFVGNRAEVSISGSARGAGIWFGGSSVVSDCDFVGNLVAGDALGAAIFGSTVSDVRVERCTIVGNVATDRDGAIRGVAGVVLEGSGRVSNTIIAFNQGLACYSNGTYSCNVLFGNTLGETICGVDGGGNIFADPQFCATDPVASMSFVVQEDSPCAPRNNGSCGLIGAFPVGCSSVSVELRSWSEVKSLFRR